MATTISDLKNSLSSGFGSRLNKYLIEIPFTGEDSRGLNILCKNATFPERNITTTSAWHHGRKYNLRGETDYGSSYEIIIMDDSKMTYRKLFDDWLKQVDNSKPKNMGIGGGSFERAISGVLDEINAGVSAINTANDLINDPSRAVDFFLGSMLDGEKAKYQTDINIWQLSKGNDKIYGYKLHNAFPSRIGSINYDDESQNTITEYAVGFTFSEFEPIEDVSAFETAAGIILGDAVVDTFNNVESLFD